MTAPPPDRRPRRTVHFAVVMAAVVAVQAVILGAAVLFVGDFPV